MDVIDGIRARIQLLAEAAGSERQLARDAKLRSESHLSLFLSGHTKDIRVRTLAMIAAGAGVSLSYLITGRSDRAGELGLDPSRHADENFPSAAYAFLELYRYDSNAVDVVNDFLDAKFDPDVAWTVDSWFDAMRAERDRRRHRLSFTAPRGA